MWVEEHHGESVGKASAQRMWSIGKNTKIVICYKKTVSININTENVYHLL